MALEVVAINHGNIVTIGGDVVGVSGVVVIFFAILGQGRIGDGPVLGIFRTEIHLPVVDFVVADIVLDVTNHVDDVVVVARGGNSRPSKIVSVLKSFGAVRQGASVDPFALTGHFSGVDTQRSVGDEDFAFVTPLGDGGPTASGSFDTCFGHIIP